MTNILVKEAIYRPWTVLRSRCSTVRVWRYACSCWPSLRLILLASSSRRLPRRSSLRRDNHLLAELFWKMVSAFFVIRLVTTVPISFRLFRRWSIRERRMDLIYDISGSLDGQPVAADWCLVTNVDTRWTLHWTSQQGGFFVLAPAQASRLRYQQCN